MQACVIRWTGSWAWRRSQTTTLPAWAALPLSRYLVVQSSPMRCTHLTQAFTGAKKAKKHTPAPTDIPADADTHADDDNEPHHKSPSPPAATATTTQPKDKKPKKPKKKKSMTVEHVDSPAAPVDMTLTADMSAWQALGVNDTVCYALQQLGFLAPTPIQEAVLPRALVARRDIVGAAETGSGKTLAFGIPILQHLMQSRKFVRQPVHLPHPSHIISQPAAPVGAHCGPDARACHPSVRPPQEHRQTLRGACGSRC